MASDSSAVVPTVVTGVEGEDPCARPPPYDEATSMEGEGVYCYKCNVYRTNSWDKLYTHLRLRCLNTREKALLVNSYVHTVEERAASQSAGHASLTRGAGSTSRGQRKRDTAQSTDGASHLARRGTSGTNEYARCTPSRLAAADRFSTEHARRVARCVIAH